jgi:Tfp pilus assembly protein PilF
MPSATPTPVPKRRNDDVTQPNAQIPPSPEDARRGLTRSPAQWEAEALAMVEEADARTGIAAGILRYAAARMFEDGVGDLAAAMDHLQLALDEPPSATFRPVLRALRLHAVEAGSPWTAIDLLDIEMAAAGTVATKAELAVQKAGLLENPLGARERARAVIEEALSLVPGHTGALLALEESAIRGGDAALLQSVLDRRLAAAATAGERGRLLCRLALLAEANPERTGDALDLWLRALNEDAGKGAAALARAGTRRVAARVGKDAALARAVELEAEAATGPERAAWLGLAAALARHRLGASARAVALVEEARAADPNDPALLYLSVANHLEAGQWSKARLCLDHHAELSKDRDWSATLAGFGAHLAEHHERDDEAAAARYRRLLEARPGDPVGLVALERIASRTGDAPAQVRLAEAAVDRSGDAGERAALAMRAAELAETAAHDLPRAAGLARRALEAVPGYAPAAHVLERLYATLGQWGELVKVVEVDASAAAVGDRSPASPAGAARESARQTAVRFERVGALYEERLQDPGKALALYGEWAELGERRQSALRALLRAAEKAGDALIAAEAALKLGTEIPELPVEARFAWCYRAAVIYEERAAADDEAVRAYEAALALDPSSRPALAGLARAHYRGGQLEALAGVLLKQAASEPNPSGASALAVEAARIYVFRLGRVDDALSATSRALSLDPANVAAIAEHARLLGRIARGEELADALGGLGQALADPIDKAAAYRLQAEIAEWQLGGKREALAAVERAAAAMSAERHSGAAAIRIALQRLYQLVGRGAEQAAAELARLSDGQRAPDVGRSLDLAWRLGDPESAWRAVRAALDAAPGDGAVLDAAVTLATKLGRDRDRAQALEKLAASSGNAATGAILLRAAATARERAATRSNEALADTLPLLRRVVETHATEEGLASLERQATRAGEWPLVILARGQLAEAAPDGATRATLLWELGCARLASGDLRGADTDFAHAIEADATLLPALRAQARLREALGDARAAAELYAREARLTKAPARAADGFRQAGRLYANQVRDDAMAGRCLEEVLALEPEAETDFEVLDVILRAKGDTDRLAQVMRRRAAAGPLPKRRDRLLALADLIYERDPIEAASVLGEAVTLDPSSVAALVRLAEVEAEIGRSADAIATYRLAITASSDPKGVGVAWARIGDIAERALADVAQAVDAYRNALLSTPDDLPALAGLSRGLVRQRDWSNAAATLRRLAAVESERDARVGHLVALGELLAGPAEDPEGAADAFEGALAVHPSNAVAIDRLDAILTELEEPSRLAAALGRFLEVTPEARDRRMRLAALWSGPLASNGRAIDELRIVVSGDERDVQARAELARVLEAADRLPEAITEHIALLRIEALRVDSLRALRRLCDRTGQRRRALRTASALVALGLTDVDDARTVRESRVRWAPEANGGVNAGEFDSYVRHPDERHPATALLAAMSEVLPRLYGLALEDWGVTKQDRLAARSDDPIRALIGRTATLLGVDDTFDVYLARSVVTRVEIEAGPPPALLVPANLLSQPLQDACLQIGRQLGHLRAGTHGIARIPGKDLGLLVVAGVRTVYPDYGRGVLPEEQLNDVAQKIARMLPRRQRRAFEQAALSFRDGGMFEAERWRVGLLHTGHRAALVASGDVLGAFEQIVREDRDLAGAAARGGEGLVTAARENPQIVEMINFAVSDELAGINRRLGID